jgi:hypothetical protein
MTPAASILDPASNPELYVTAVLTLFVDLPDTPLRTSALDRRQACIWLDGNVPLAVIETALLLGSLRRLMRPPDVPRLPRIRSLAYFQPIVEELLENPAPNGYLPYLRSKMRTIAAGNSVPADVQKPTFSRDR